MVKSTTIQSDVTAQFSLFDEQFSEQLEQLQLFMQIGKDGLLIARFHEASKQYVGLESYTFSKNDWFSTKTKIEKIIVQKQYTKAKSITISIADNMYTLIPKELFDSNQLQNYLSFNHSIEEVDQWRFHADFIESFDAYIIYAFPRGLDFMVRAKLANYKWHHAAYPLLEAIYLDKKNYEQLHLHLREKTFDIVYAPEGKLHFFNSFEYQTDEDVLYYLLYVMEQLELEREVHPIKLWGEFDKEGTLYKSMFQYVKELQIGERPSNVNFSTILSNLAPQQYFNIFNQHLCA